jgi:hypothetical protein
MNLTVLVTVSCAARRQSGRAHTFALAGRQAGREGGRQAGRHAGWQAGRQAGRG